MRNHAPNIPLLWANIGAVQLNYGVTADDCQRLVDRVRADGLILHLNPLQEMVQAEGDQNWSGLLSKIGHLTRAINVPVIVKEVGYGLSGAVARQLIEAGVYVLDVAGAGGTSWTAVESHRAPTALHQKIAASFSDWGLTTHESLRAARSVSDSIPLIASGGIDNGITAAKAIHAGATLVGMAGPLLKPAATSDQALDEAIALFKAQLRITMMCTGAKTLKDLAASPYL